MPKRPRYEDIGVLADLLFDCLNKYNPKSLEGLLIVLGEVKVLYRSTRNLKSVSGIHLRYLQDAKVRISEADFEYDEVLKALNIEYGYNPSTGVWDGNSGECKIGGINNPKGSCRERKLGLVSKVLGDKVNVLEGSIDATKLSNLVTSVRSEYLRVSGFTTVHKEVSMYLKDFRLFVVKYEGQYMKAYQKVNIKYGLIGKDLDT